MQHQQIGVADVEVQAQLRQGIEQLAQLRRCVKVPRQVLDHQSDTSLHRIGEKLAQRGQILLDEEAAVVHRGVAVRMDVHPAYADGGEHVDAPAQLVNRGLADLLDAARDRQVEGGVPHHLQAVALQGAANRHRIHSPGGGHGRLQGEIDETESHRGHPLDLLEDVPRRVVHGADQHVRVLRESRGTRAGCPGDRLGFGSARHRAPAAAVGGRFGPTPDRGSAAPGLGPARP